MHIQSLHLTPQTPHPMSHYIDLSSQTLVWIHLVYAYEVEICVCVTFGYCTRSILN